MTEIIKLSESSTYEDLLAYIEYRREGSLSTKAVLNEVFEFYREYIGKDKRIESMMSKLIKEVKIPDKLNSTGSDSFKFDPNRGSNRSQRRKHDSSNETKQTLGLDEKRRTRMKAKFNLDPDNEEDLKTYSYYLTEKMSLSTAEKRVFDKLILQNSIFTINAIKEIAIQAKNN